MHMKALSSQQFSTIHPRHFKLRIFSRFKCHHLLKIRATYALTSIGEKRRLFLILGAGQSTTPYFFFPPYSAIILPLHCYISNFPSSRFSRAKRNELDKLFGRLAWFLVNNCILAPCPYIRHLSQTTCLLYHYITSQLACMGGTRRGDG